MIHSSYTFVFENQGQGHMKSNLYGYVRIFYYELLSED